MESLTFKLEDFEGPLDLLLYLISKNKMDLHDIPILELIDQYTALIQTLGEDRLDAASEFIEMAAQLVQMKSFLLLPRSEEAERMKQELQGQLIEYDSCKRVATKMGLMAAKVYYAVRPPAQVELETEYRLRHDKQLLPQAWYGLMGRSLHKRQPSQERFEPLVTAPFVSVASRVVHVLRGLMRGRFRRLGQLFDRNAGRSETVATFLAVLELVRAGRLSISPQEELTVNRGRLDRRENRGNTDEPETV